MMRPKVSGYELRLLADRASDAGQKELSMRLHDLARAEEATKCGSLATVAVS